MSVVARVRNVNPPPTTIAQRVTGLDWPRVGAELDLHGCAVANALLSPEECAALVDTYAMDQLFRSRVVMARHGFGRGEYK